MTHLCHAVGCRVPVPPRMLMCRSHWRMVDPKNQDLIWATYVPGQEVRKDPSLAYLVAQAHIVAGVAVAEGVWSEEQAGAHVTDLLSRMDGESIVEAYAALTAHDPVFLPTLVAFRRLLAEQRRFS